MWLFGFDVEQAHRLAPRSTAWDRLLEECCGLPEGLLMQVVRCRDASYNSTLAATAAFRLSTGPGQGIAIVASAFAIKSAGTPLPSFPITRATGPPNSASSAGFVPRAVVASTFTPASRNRSMLSSALAASSGTRNTLPADARTAFGFHALTVPGKLTTPVAPNASADRRIVPRFPGS